MKKLITICLVASLMLISTSASWASSVTPPPSAPGWWNSETGLYAYGWWQADIVSGNIEVSPADNSSHWASNYLENDDFEASIGIGTSDGTVSLELGNEYHQDLYKQIYIYITGTTNSTSENFGTVIDPDGGIFNPQTIYGTIQGSQWIYVAFGEIHPQPEYVNLTVTVPGMLSVTNIWVGERCIPEPATMSLLGLGALSLIRRKKLKGGM